MSDISTGGDAPETQAAPAAVPAPAPAAAPAASAEPDIFDDARVQTFDRTYVEKLRQEAAGYRTSLKAYEPFQQYAPEDLEVWADLARTLAQDPAAAAQRFTELGQKLSEQFAPKEAPTTEEPKAGEPLTADQLEAFLAERDRKLEMERAVTKINDDIAAKYGAGSPEAHLALRFAANDTQGDLEAAFAKVEAYHQSIIDGFLTGKRNQAENPNPVTHQGAPSGEGQPVKDFAGARAATLARLAASRAE